MPEILKNCQIGKISPNLVTSCSKRKFMALVPGSGKEWKKAFEFQLAEQTIFNNVVNVLFSLVIRIIGKQNIN